MLKRPDEEPAGAERPIGDLVRELIDEGKAYAMAELDVVKAIARAKGKALALPAGLFAAALILALAGITALAAGLVIALAKFVGPFAAGLIGLLLFAGLAGGCGWYGYQRLRRDL
jgi:hypothetical protein